MMKKIIDERFIKEYVDEKIIFTDLKTSQKITVKHYDDFNSFDLIKIDKSLRKDFVEYIIQELQNTNDIGDCLVLYDDEEIQKIFHRNHFIVSNYHYKIPYQSCLSNSLISFENFNDDVKKYYLEMLNQEDCQYNNYAYPEKEYEVVDDSWFSNDLFQYIAYQINNKIVGVVEFKIFDWDEKADSVEIDELFDYNGKITVRALFADTLEIKVQILQDLLNRFRRPIIICSTYTNNELRKAILTVNGKFMYTQYICKDIMA